MGSSRNAPRRATPRRRPRRSVEDVAVDAFAYLFCVALFLVTFYPFWYALIVSFDNGIDFLKGGVFLWPRQFSLANYKVVFSSTALVHSAFVSVARTVVGTAGSVLATGLFAYGMLEKDLLFRRLYVFLMVFSMYVSGGIVPVFLLYRATGLLDTFWVYVVPSLLSVFNVIIMLSYFRELPASLRESARIDGANELTIYLRIIMPVSLPIVATIALFNGVAQWNNWFDTAFFAPSRNLRTLSFMLKEIVNQMDVTSVMGATDTYESVERQKHVIPETIRMATMLVVVVPIICVYPFLQRYFIKGMLVGSIKG